jgi:aryl-alcohol dehydrogenase-like predicted oxidoreductase
VRPARHRVRAVHTAGIFPAGREAILSDPVVVGVARALDLTSAQVVLAWLAAVSPNVLLIPGTSSLRHLEENLAVSRIELDAPTIARLEGAFAGRDR